MEREIVVDSEFKSLIPPLTSDEYSGLEESILHEGCRDALVLWDDKLIDGHNRYEICSRHGIPFKTVQMEFANRDEVHDWIIDNQCSRRNLPLAAQIMLKLQKSSYRKEQAKINSSQNARKNENRNSDFRSVNINKEIAKEVNANADTVSKVRQIEAKATPEVKEQLRSGAMSINQAYKAVRLVEKKQEIKQAEQQIVEQATEEYKPILRIGNGIGFVPNEKYDLLLTDPPYSTDVDDIDAFVDSWLFNALNNVKPTGFAYVFIGAYPEEVRAYLNAKIPDHMKLEQILVWTYKNTLGQNPKERYKLNYQDCLFYRGMDAPDLDCPLTTEQWAVQEINAPDGRQGDRYHAWQKPMEIAERFIRHSTKPGDIVFDPFACTGTFLLASAKLGRKAYGFEIDPGNASIATERGCILGE